MTIINIYVYYRNQFFYIGESGCVSRCKGQKIRADKIRAVYERKYLKGRDIYDIWWLTTKHHVKPSWPLTKAKLEMYQTAFFPARKAGYFQQKKNAKEIISALTNDLPRFIPQEIYAVYKENDFKQFMDALKHTTSVLMDRGLKDYFLNLA